MNADSLCHGACDVIALKPSNGKEIDHVLCQNFLDEN